VIFLALEDSAKLCLTKEEKEKLSSATLKPRGYDKQAISGVKQVSYYNKVLGIAKLYYGKSIKIGRAYRKNELKNKKFRKEILDKLYKSKEDVFQEMSNHDGIDYTIGLRLACNKPLSYINEEKVEELEQQKLAQEEEIFEYNRDSISNMSQDVWV
jgi:hypothetical protein